jgi:hypothetical protein
LNYINQNISDSELEKIMENYANTIENDEEMFNFDENDSDNESDNYDFTNDNGENLQVEEILDFTKFSDENNNNNNNNMVYVVIEDNEDYDINEIINASTNINN